MRSPFGATIQRFYPLLTGLFVGLCAIAASGCGQGACAMELPGPQPSQAAPGETFRLQGGQGFAADCFDTFTLRGLFGPPSPERDIRIELRQGNSTWSLDTVDAGPSPEYALDAELTVPDDAEPGSATIMMHPNSASPIEIPFRVLGEETVGGGEGVRRDDFAPESAPSQEGDSSGAIAVPEGELAPDIPYFVLEEDGTVIVDVDSVTNCRSFILGLEQEGFSSGGNLEQTQRVQEGCEQLGLASGGDLDTGDAEVVLELDDAGPAVPGGDSVDTGALPDTGGVLLFPLAAGLALLASGAGLLAYRRFR